MGKNSLDIFYSAESTESWQSILGPELHYHFGYFKAKETLQEGLKAAVRLHYPFIQRGSRVLDLGCGWGGPALMLIEERECEVLGLTISSAQAEYARSLGLSVRHMDAETEEIDGNYDTVLMHESFTHIKDKAGLLSRLKSVAHTVIITASCLREQSSSQEFTFGNSMLMTTPAELQQMILKAGWEVIYQRERRFQSLRTLKLWRENLENFFGSEPIPEGQMKCLYDLTEFALVDPLAWFLNNPLIDIVARQRD